MSLWANPSHPWHSHQNVLLYQWSVYIAWSRNVWTIAVLVQPLSTNLVKEIPLGHFWSIQQRRFCRNWLDVKLCIGKCEHWTAPSAAAPCPPRFQSAASWGMLFCYPFFRNAVLLFFLWECSSFIPLGMPFFYPLFGNAVLLSFLWECCSFIPFAGQGWGCCSLSLSLGTLFFIPFFGNAVLYSFLLGTLFFIPFSRPRLGTLFFIPFLRERCF